MRRWVLSTQEFYTRLTDYMFRTGLPWDGRDEQARQAEIDEECEILSAAMGAAHGGSVLDCACGWGRQAIPLAKLGWRVTAADVTEANMNIARQCAEQERVKIDFCGCDMLAPGRRVARARTAVPPGSVACYRVCNPPTRDPGVLVNHRGLGAASRSGSEARSQQRRSSLD